METELAKPKRNPRSPVSAECRQQMSETRRGVPKSEEHKAKIGASNKGKVRTPEFRLQMSEIKKAQWKNKKRACERT